MGARGHPAGARAVLASARGEGDPAQHVGPLLPVRRQGLGRPAGGRSAHPHPPAPAVPDDELTRVP
ncbi:hypothetical protein SGPA1_40349 [Streptomyces misionensis JCM 4497]